MARVAAQSRWKRSGDAISPMRRSNLHLSVLDSPHIIPQPTLVFVEEGHVDSNRLAVVRIGNCNVAKYFIAI